MGYARVETTQLKTLAGYLMLLSLVSLAVSCASITPPEGGDRDTKAPVLLRTLPASGARSVTGKQLTLQFDEAVTTEQLSDQLVISPETKLGTPRVVERDNNLTLIFQRPFAPNTTYSVDFGQAVVDVTEKNKAANARLVFSTGAALDSGRVAGRVTNLLTGQPAANVFVGLYSLTSADSTGPGQQTAQYRAKTSSAGKFSYLNLKPAKYRLFAFADANNNRRYDEPELLAYLPDTLNAQQPDTTIVLRLARLDTRPPFIASRKERIGGLTLQYSEGIRNARLRWLNVEPSGAPRHRRSEKDPRQLVLLGKPRETAQRVLIIAQDSAGNEHADTVATRFTALVAPQGSLTPLIDLVKVQELDRWQLTFPLLVETTKAIIGTISVKRTQGKTTDSLRTQSLRIGQSVRLDSSSSVLTVDLPGAELLKAEGELVLTLDSLALSTSTGQPVTGRPLPLPRPPDAASVGTITVKLQTSSRSFELELVRKDNSVVRRYEHWVQASAPPQTIPATVTWANLPPDSYRLRARIDKNRDGRWNGPERSFRRRPEAVSFSPNELTVRANWEQELTFEF